MLFCRKTVCIPLHNPQCLSTLVVFWFRNKAACKRMGGCRCSSGKAPGACPVACACDDGGCIAGEAGAGVMVGGVEVVADERPDFGRNRVAAASTGDSVVVSGVLTEGEDGF